ncbi:tripartite tricarboxylate transporter substrate binding protein (plasmid) [Photobacterium sp. GJ3]|uniref:Bug family tripartite tricarboxylate transporter substrate binding protein n=1 Tax=Photobacterium sp. GJ3 TaxID=2829502 RepID=UPI001B8BFB8B|nr:tripartite tricarboxylate transporter substrate binding protein [Photobacterium sp. GJ3]QUJ70236.1 tripartite tricarboxylate transporter substrate binding protein [Photobacterium sp. GJ3]
MKKGIFYSSIICALYSTGAVASEYPDKAITLVAPYSAGGASDIAARSLALVAQKYTDDTPIVVINKTGNGGMVGASYVSKSKPDGYTLLLSRVGMSLYPAVNKQSPTDWDDYSFLSIVESTPMILAVNAKSGIQTIEQLIEKIKAEPGRLTYAASGPLAIDGFTVQALLDDNGIQAQSGATLIPYTGGGAMASALLGGHIDFLAIAGSSLIPHIESGKLTPLLVYATDRLSSMPDVPTAKEMGYIQAGQITGWSGLYGPKNLPQDVVEKWQSILTQVEKDSEWKELVSKRSAISLINQVDAEAFAGDQYKLFVELSKKFGY